MLKNVLPQWWTVQQGVGLAAFLDDVGFHILFPYQRSYPLPIQGLLSPPNHATRNTAQRSSQSRQQHWAGRREQLPKLPTVCGGSSQELQLYAVKFEDVPEELVRPISWKQ